MTKQRIIALGIKIDLRRDPYRPPAEHVKPNHQEYRMSALGTTGGVPLDVLGDGPSANDGDLGVSTGVVACCAARRVVTGATHVSINGDEQLNSESL